MLGDEDIFRLYKRGAKHIVTCDINAENCGAIAAQLSHVDWLGPLSDVTVELKRDDIFNIIPQYDRIHSVFFDFEKCYHPKPTALSGVEKERLDMWKIDRLIGRLVPLAHLHFTYAQPDRVRGHGSEVWMNGHREFSQVISSKLPVETDMIDWDALDPMASSLWFALVAHHMFGYTTEAALSLDEKFAVPSEGFLVDGTYRDYRDKGHVPMQTTWFGLSLVDNPVQYLEESLSRMQSAFARHTP